MNGSRKFHLSRKQRKIVGLCGGISEYFGWDPGLVRWLAVSLLVLSLVFHPALTFALLLIYFTSPLFLPYE
ncbi:MAG: PspC domain-containing protein [bacterium JZ-2024 1]